MKNRETDVNNEEISGVSENCNSKADISFKSINLLHF